VGERALALDLGTSSVRAAVFEATGPGKLRTAEMARRERHIVTAPPGRASFDLGSYFSDLVACIDELHEKKSLSGVTDVGLSCQWHSIAALDGQGRPLGEALSWADTRPTPPWRRSQPTCSEPARSLPGPGELEALRQRTGCAFGSMYWTWRAPWLAAQVTDQAGAGTALAASKVARFAGLAEYVGGELLGDSSMSVSMASGTGLLATAALDWDSEALALAGLRREQLPPLAPEGWQGRLTGRWRQRWPELGDALWHPPLGDGAAANLGVGCGSPGKAAITIGTSAAVRAVRLAPDLSELPGALWRYCVDRSRVLIGAAYSSGGQLYSWALSLWQGVPRDREHELRFDLPMPVPPGSGGVLVVPWHAGTRPPEEAVPGGQGCVAGLGLDHTGAHITSAVAEAVCFQLADGLGAVEASCGEPLEVVANGGAIERSPWWQRRLASTLAKPVRFPKVPETTARGAAAFALGVELAGDEEVELALPGSGEELAALAEARLRWHKLCGQLLPIARSPTAAL
jgi:gluconokinase